jgi:hypothetical protein
MAFAVRNLSVLAYANGFTLWHYKAGVDILETAGQPGFFSTASDMLTAGDILMISAADGAQLLCVMPNSGTEVKTLRLA